MAAQVVFLDRDNTLTEDPGYLADPGALKLLPGVAPALKSLQQSGFKLVVVTNQSGIARGMFTEDTLRLIHEQLQRKLAEHGVTLDAIYYCPYHPEGSVEQYARESDERKPQPGMLLRAAREMDLDLPSGWMVGDGARDIEAGQRAGCRTIRVLAGDGHVEEAPDEDEGVRADFTVRNLPEAARIILREKGQTPPSAAPAGVRALRESSAGREPTDSEVLRELLQVARQLMRMHQHSEFSASKLVAGICQGLAVIALALGFFRFVGVTSPTDQADAYWWAMGWLAIAGVLQLLSLTFFMMGRSD